MSFLSDLRTTARNLVLMIGVAACAMGLLFAGTAASTAGKPANRYIGAQKCKNCHQAEVSGHQYKKWTEMKHSHAFEVLGTDEAKKVAAAQGIAEPQKSEVCLKCHVTGYGEPEEKFKKGFKQELGVQCESCHGPGEKHMKARFAAATDASEQRYVAIPDEEIIRAPTMATCLGCHNEKSPSFKPFCFHERIAKIRHLNPLKPRTEKERAALLVCGCGESCGCVHGCEEGKCGVPPGKDAGR